MPSISDSDQLSRLPPELAAVGLRPSMFLRTTSFDTAVAYLMGYDAALRGGLLFGFREWLVVRLGAGNNLAWTELAHDLLLQQSPGMEEHELVRPLFHLLDEFLVEVGPRKAGLGGILQAHREWLQTRP